MGTMGYDRAITVFNPEGRLLQVEYAQKAVSSGAIAMGLVCKDAVVLMANRPKVDGLLVIEHTQKIFDIDKHVSSAAAGIIADARVLVKNARDNAQQHRLTYGEGVDIKSLVTYIANIKQTYTQYGGIRPFGISMLIGGIDSQGSALYITEPTGTYFRYHARAVGLGAEQANSLLAKHYKPGMSAEEGLKLAQKILKQVLKKDYTPAKIECSIVRKSGITKQTVKG